MNLIVGAVVHGGGSFVRKDKGQIIHKSISARLGNDICGVRPYVLSIVANIMMHVGLFMLSDHSVYSLVRLFISFVFFIYPYYFVADVFWSMCPDVSAILTGEVKINRRHYTNTIRTDIPIEQLLPVTVSIPVFMEENAVIFETIRQSVKAIDYYCNSSGKGANIVVSDDGLAQLLGGYVTQAHVKELLSRIGTCPEKLSEKERKAADRIRYYRENGIAFAARPAQNRAGLFKKASNLNYTLRLGNRPFYDAPSDALFAAGGAFEYGYAEGDIRTHEIILLLDKDSGVHKRIIEAVVPEFIADARLAYAQCATNAANLSENYFSRAVGYWINNLFHNIWPCKALQGFFVPLVGHNVFLRKSLLEESGLWSEDRVSEDYDKAIGFYNMGCYGKYIHFAGLEFTEYVSRSHAEEAGKQLRYSYGLLEMLLQGTIRIGRTRRCDMFYMILYFCSILNAAMLLPSALLECHFGNIHLLWAGFIFCHICFILLPCIRSFSMRRRLPKEQLGNLRYTGIMALSFLGHTYSMLAGVCKYFVDRIRPNPKPFPASNVDAIGNRYVDGMKILRQYLRKNKGFFLVTALCIERGIFMVTCTDTELPTLLTYGYIFFIFILVPILLTPQLYIQPARSFKNIYARIRHQKRKHNANRCDVE